MFFDDVVADGQSEACAFADGFGGEEGFEQPALYCLVHSRARVGNDDFDFVGFFSIVGF